MSTAVATSSTEALVGFTSKNRYRAAWAWSGVSGTYTDDIPVDDIRDELFYWKALEGRVSALVMNEDGSVERYADPTRMAVIRPDTRKVLGIHGFGSYRIHQFPVWLLDNIVPVLGGKLGLGIGLAVALKDGAVAAVSIEMPESIVTPEGIEFRPHLMATTSHDASLSTTYHRGVTVFGHPMAAGIAKRVEGQRVFKIRHTKNSISRLSDATEAALVIEDIVADFQEEVTELVLTSVSNIQRDDFLEKLYPTPEEDGRAKTIAIDRQANIRRLLNDDDRLQPWRYTAWGVLLAVNIANHELGIVRGDRDERNLTKMVYGSYIAEDQEALKKLQEVL
jgi:phage/plasmid-like protein (TIGR03299 family)